MKSVCHQCGEVHECDPPGLPLTEADGAPWVKVTCMVPPDAIGIWLAARHRYERAHGIHKHPTIANGQVLESLCAEYIAGPDVH